MSTQEQCAAIVRKIVEFANAGEPLTFTKDWGGNSLTVIAASDAHTHVGDALCRATLQHAPRRTWAILGPGTTSDDQGHREAEVMSQRSLLEANSGAEFSPCRTYRYSLYRNWDWQGYANCVMFLMLNPSTADHTENDPTIRRCIGFAKSWGYGGLVVCNLFAFRATNPAEMLAAVDPIGPGNDETLAYQRTHVGLIVAAWGSHGTHQSRGEAIKSVIGRRLDCLGLTKQGQPKHPLYLAADTQPQHFWSPEL